MHLPVVLSLLANYFGTQHQSPTVFILDCMNQSENVELMKQSSLLGFRSDIILLDDENLNISQTIQKMLYSTRFICPVDVLFNYDCPYSKSFMSACATARCFAQQYKWLIFEENIDSAAIQHLEVSPLFIDAEIGYINFAIPIEPDDKSSGRYAIHDIYNNAYTHGGRLNVTLDRYFVYDTKNGGYLSESRIQLRTKYENRRNLSDITIRIGLILVGSEGLNESASVLAVLQSDNDTTYETQSRHAGNVVSIVAEMLRCNLTFTNFDYWTSNDSYGEALQALHEDRIDLPYGIYLYTLERFPYLTASTQVTYFRSFFFFRTTKNVNLLGDEMLQPFESSIWFNLILTVALASTIMTFIYRWERRVKRASSESMALEGDSTFVAAFGVYCQQGAARLPTLTSGRSLLIFICLSSIMIENYYTSVLVSILVSSSSQTSIKTITDLTNSKYKIGFDRVAYLRGFLNTTAEPEHLYLIKKRLNKSGIVDVTPFIHTTREGFKLVQGGDFAFHSEGSTAYPVIAATFEPNQICDLNTVRFRQAHPQGIIVRKRSPFLSMVSTRAYWMREAGVLSKQERRWVAAKPDCLSNAIVTSVGFDYTAPLFLFLVISFIFVLIIMVLENIYYRFQQRRSGRQ